MNIKWNDKIMNEKLQKITHQKSVENQIKRRKWNLDTHYIQKQEQ